jgi:hypothetical protein
MKTVLLGLSLDGNLVKPLTSIYGTEWRDRGYGLWTWEFVIDGSWTGKNWKTEMVCFWRHSSFWQFSFWDRTEHRNCGFSLTLRVNSNFLLNKQLFSSLKIHRFMVSWTKIPHPRKKSGKYTGLKSASVGQQKIRGISVWVRHFPPPAGPLPAAGLEWLCRYTALWCVGLPVPTSNTNPPPPPSPVDIRLRVFFYTNQTCMGRWLRN